MGYVIKALAELLHLTFQIFIFIILLRSLMSWVGNIPANKLTIILRRMTDPIFRFVHRNIPFTIVRGIDISPIFILIILYVIDNVIYTALRNFAVQNTL